MKYVYSKKYDKFNRYQLIAKILKLREKISSITNNKTQSIANTNTTLLNKGDINGTTDSSNNI